MTDGMKSLTEDLFQNGTCNDLRYLAQWFIEVLQLDPTSRKKGYEVQTITIELKNVRRYYTVKLVVDYENPNRFTTVADARKINLNEYVLLAWMEDPDMRIAYFRMIKVINRI